MRGLFQYMRKKIFSFDIFWLVRHTGGHTPIAHKFWTNEALEVWTNELNQPWTVE